MKMRYSEDSKLLFKTIEGNGPPLVLVHGSWGDHHNWDLVAPKLGKSFRVTRYDRRGHSQSIETGPQGVKEDLEDLASLIEVDGKAHVVGNSFGALLSIKLAAERPELFETLIVHEPPLVSLLEKSPLLDMAGEKMRAVAELLRAGKMEEGARTFVETVGFGPGVWQILPEQQRQTYIANARTWLDEYEDPNAFTIDLQALARFDKPALLTMGNQSPPIFKPILEKIHQTLPKSELVQLKGVGHVPHITRPDDWVNRVTEFVRRASGSA